LVSGDPLQITVNDEPLMLK
jgi:hypothetical protein